MLEYVLVGSWVKIGNIYFYTTNIEASSFVYLQSEVLTAFCTIKQCACLLMNLIESDIDR